MAAESISKYIVWDLISPYDGYAQTHCNNLDEVHEAINKSSNLTAKEKKSMISGNSDHILVIEKNSVMKDVFVTSGPLKVNKKTYDFD